MNYIETPQEIDDEIKKNKIDEYNRFNEILQILNFIKLKENNIFNDFLNSEYNNKYKNIFSTFNDFEIHLINGIENYIKLENIRKNTDGRIDFTENFELLNFNDIFWKDFGYILKFLRNETPVLLDLKPKTQKIIGTFISKIRALLGVK